MLKKIIKNTLLTLLITFIFVINFPLNLINADNHVCHDKTFDIPFSTVKATLEGLAADITEYTLPAGNYYLDEDCELIKNLVIAEGTEVNLCLNGHVLKIGAHIIKVMRGILFATLNIYDCKKDDSHIHYFGIVSKPSGDIDDGDGLWELVNTQTDYFVKGGVITGATKSIEVSTSLLNSSGNLNIDGANFVGNWTNSAGVIVNSQGTLNIKNATFMGNIGTGSAGAIEVKEGNTNIYNSVFKYNLTKSDGGAIANKHKLLVKDSVIENNKSSSGGGIKSWGNLSLLTLINTSIKNNVATNNGGGVYLKTTASCLKEGTLIKMADGTDKPIEDVKENEYVKSFDHLLGKFVDEKVYYAYKGNSLSTTFTLHFDDGNNISIAGLHDLFSKNMMQYVTITSDNYNEYIGDSFFNATTNKWTKLIKVTEDKEESSYYSLYTTHTFNCIANNMLTVADDADHSLNIFVFNDDLSVNQKQLEEDINKYGLMKFEDCKTVTWEEYDIYRIKYLNIIIGKGLATLEEVLGYGQEIADNHEAQQKENDKSLSIFKINKVHADDVTCETYATGKSAGSIVIGSGVVIKDNKVNGANDNLHFTNGTLAYFVNGATNIDVGVNHEKVEDIISDTNASAYKSFLKTDNNLLKIILDSDTKLKIAKAYDFTKINNTTSKIVVQDIDESIAINIASLYLKNETKDASFVVAYEKVGNSYYTVKWNGTAFVTGSVKSLDDLKDGTLNSYVIGTISETGKKLIKSVDGDCSVDSNGNGYEEFTQGNTKATTMHIDGLSTTDLGASHEYLKVVYNDKELIEGTDYTVEDGSVKVVLNNSFISSLPVGTNNINAQITIGASTYRFDLNIRINSEVASTTGSTKKIDYVVVKTYTK